MSRLLKPLLVLTFFVIFFLADASAQPPGLPDAPSQAPIDGGLGLLAVAGGAYAWRKLRKNAHP